jgi:hypothetical protein
VAILQRLAIVPLVTVAVVVEVAVAATRKMRDSIAMVLRKAPHGA